MSGRESVVLVLLSAPGVSLVSYQPAPPLPLLPPTVSRPLRTVHEPLSTCVLERRARGRGWACAKNGRGATGKKHSCHVQIWSLDPLVKGWKRTSLYLWLDFCIHPSPFFLSFFLSFFLPSWLTLLHFWQLGELTMLVFILTFNASVLLGALVCSHILGTFRGLHRWRTEDGAQRPVLCPWCPKCPSVKVYFTVMSFL